MRTEIVAAAAALLLLGLAAPVPAAAQGLGSNPTMGSPLRSGAKAGCRWVEAPATTTRVCNAVTKVCRVQAVPAQRVWACGTVRH